MPFSILDCYLAFLNMSEKALKQCIDFYNSGQMHPFAMVALEIIDGLPQED